MASTVHESTLKALGARIRALRTAAGMSQSDLGGKIDKEQTSIQRLESGGVNPSFIYLKSIAEGLGISISEMLEGL